MKKLSSISPFILLLVPVFVMILVTFTTVYSNSNNQDNEVALKTTTSTPMIKINNIFIK